MTHPEQILAAVATITSADNNAIFTRENIRQQAGIDRENWDASYSPIFQAMRSDHPGGAPPIAERFRNVFERVERGKDRLTNMDRSWLLGNRPESNKNSRTVI